MSLWTKQELIEALGDELLHHDLPDNLAIDEVAIDSRKISKNSPGNFPKNFPKSFLFIALKGEKNDGHDFLCEVAQNGCRLAIIHQPQISFTQLSTILVKNTFSALYKLAEYSRRRSAAKIIAITGSVGKTSTKDMLKLTFETQKKNPEKTFATSGNLNNHIGLPLSLANFPRDCAYGIFEMGMNHLGEIQPLSHLARPHLAIITNVGPVHIEFFKNEQEIALAKSEIFSGLADDGIALINADNAHFEFLTKRASHYGVKEENIITFGEKVSANYQILKTKITSAASCEIKAKLKNGLEFDYEVATSSKATICNSIIAIACLDLFGCDLKTGLTALEPVLKFRTARIRSLPHFVALLTHLTLVKFFQIIAYLDKILPRHLRKIADKLRQRILRQALKSLQTPAGRGKVSEIKIGRKNITIIDDSYNASILSMRSGLEHAVNLKNILGKKRVIAALGDMLELGEKSVELHEEVMNYITQFHIDFAVFVGKNMTEAAKKLPQNSYKTFPDSSAASLAIQDLLDDCDILYLKGSRGMKMEKIIEILRAY